jgi:hypothetical protein
LVDFTQVRGRGVAKGERGEGDVCGPVGVQPKVATCRVGVAAHSSTHTCRNAHTRTGTHTHTHAYTLTHEQAHRPWSLAAHLTGSRSLLFRDVKSNFMSMVQHACGTAQ